MMIIMLDRRLITKYDKETVRDFMMVYCSDWCEYYSLLYDLVIEYGTEDEYIIEIGCYRAGSTLTMAFASKYKGLSKPIISIDKRCREDFGLEYYAMTSIFSGIILTTMQTEHHIAISGIGSHIVNINASSNVAFELLKNEAACLVFVDGEHSYVQTKCDILNYGGLLIPSGIIICHDYHLAMESPLPWQVSCCKAINECVRDSNLYSDFTIGGESLVWGKKI